MFSFSIENMIKFYPGLAQSGNIVITQFGTGIILSTNYLTESVCSLYRVGSIITCQVQKHGTEIIEVEVWLHFITFSKNDGAKTKTDMYKMDINVQYV